MSPASDADSTRDRIVAAAVAEFAQHGIAGARIERIAKAARTSKERVYAYFRSKEALYRFVAAQELAAVAKATALDPADLPEYAGRVHDHYVAHPERLRLMSWGRLEFADADDPDGPFYTIMRNKVKQVRRAQDAGLLDAAWDPVDILIFVTQLATAWAGQLDLVAATADLAREPSLAARRAAVVAAVRHMFPAAESTETTATANKAATTTKAAEKPPTAEPAKATGKPAAATVAATEAAENA